jgi:hypothetical protein
MRTSGTEAVAGVSKEQRRGPALARSASLGAAWLSSSVHVRRVAALTLASVSAQVAPAGSLAAGLGDARPVGSVRFPAAPDDDRPDFDVRLVQPAAPTSDTAMRAASTATDIRLTWFPRSSHAR